MLKRGEKFLCKYIYNTPFIVSHTHIMRRNGKIMQSERKKDVSCVKFAYIK